jgi:hypothetical protein
MKIGFLEIVAALGGLSPFGLLGIYYRSAFSSPKRYLALYQPVAKLLLAIALLSFGAMLGMAYMHVVQSDILYSHYRQLSETVIPQARELLYHILVPGIVGLISAFAFLIAAYLVEHANREITESQEQQKIREILEKYEAIEKVSKDQKSSG